MAAEPAIKQEENLIRALGVPTLTASIVNATIGAGIFVLPAVVAAGLGAAAPIAFLICAVVMALVVTSFAIAGSRVSLTGGLYAYVEVAFGSYIGFLAGVLLWLTNVLAVAGVASAIVASLAVIFPAVQDGVGRFLILVLIFSGLALINIRGVRAGADTVAAMTIAKLLPLLLFIGVGVFFINPAALGWSVWPGGDAIGKTVLLLIFAFMGIELALVPSGEVKNPARTVPRSIFLALAITTALYVAIQLVAQGVLGAELSKFRGCAAGGGGVPVSGPYRAHDRPGRRGDFRLRICQRRHPGVASHALRLRARRNPAGPDGGRAPALSDAAHRNHRPRYYCLRPLGQQHFPISRSPFEHRRVVALPFLLLGGL